tara:strand:+ start:5069 stop:8383 length:3315 start_codon:yes stop_codon:yes gene_type:complete
MAEQTFKSAGFFDFETEISNPQAAASGVPIAVIGTATRGPAFQPVYFGRQDAQGAGTLQNFVNKFGTIDATTFGPYAIKAWFDSNSSAAQYIRVLGAGANTTSGHFSNTTSYGIVNNAGFKIHHPNPHGAPNGLGPAHSVTTSSLDNGEAGGQPSAMGTVFFLAAKHTVSANADVALPHFTDNDSFKGLYDSDGSPAADDVHLIRAMIFTNTGSKIQISDYSDDKQENENGQAGLGTPAFNKFVSGSVSTLAGGGLFKIIVSSSDGTAFGNDDGRAGYRVFTASLDPDNANYVSKVLNTDPYKLDSSGHMLYIDWPVTAKVAPVSTAGASIALLSGSGNSSNVGLGDNLSGDGAFDKWQNMFGRFDTRYTTPRTPYMISQPYGNTEHDLFYFEALDDGAYANTKYKISIQNIKASTDPKNPYGKFDVVLRDFYDSDTAQQVLERFAGVSIDPEAKNYIGKAIGDKKLTYGFDAPVDQRRFTRKGIHQQKSIYIRVVASAQVANKLVAPGALPFGFRGIPVLKTSFSIREVSSATATELAGYDSGDHPRLHACLTGSALAFTGSILPPLPFRFKQAKGGNLSNNPNFIGEPGDETAGDPRLYWGIQFENQRNDLKPWKIYGSDTSTRTTNGVVEAYSKFQGIQKLGTLHTGSYADEFNNNKFTLAKVALVNQLQSGALTHITASARAHIKDASYIRNATVNPVNYTVYDRVLAKPRITLATLLAKDKNKFNKFAAYNKFNTMFYGGFDGLNIFDKNCQEMNDRSTSTEAHGYALSTVSNGLAAKGGLGTTGSADGTLLGDSLNNNAIQSYRSAIDIINDKYKSIHHVLAIPGIREPLITDYAAQKTEEYQMAIYVMDLPNYDVDGTRIYIEDTSIPSVTETVSTLLGRSIDSNYTATYFPDVIIKDEINNNRNTEVPASIAAISALSYNDNERGVWYAPAGFRRGSLDLVKNTTSRLSTGDRDELYEASVNPIANFPASNQNFVEYKIWGQKTMQESASSLDRVNVRRMVLEVKRQVLQIARRLLFKRNNPAARKSFISAVSTRLAFIQSARGIEKYKIIMDDTNNTLADQQQYKLNGKVMIIPTRTIEFVSIDFVIDPDGVTFQ